MRRDARKRSSRSRSASPTMEESRKRWLFRLAALIVLGLAGLLWTAREWSQNLLTIENSSGEPITLLRITVVGESGAFQDVGADGKVATNLRMRSGDRFAIEGRLKDGTVVRGSGMSDGQANLVVSQGGQIMFQPRGKMLPFSAI
jgi:hypothetical protein